MSNEHIWLTIVREKTHWEPSATIWISAPTRKQYSSRDRTDLTDPCNQVRNLEVVDHHGLTVSGPSRDVTERTSTAESPTSRVACTTNVAASENTTIGIPLSHETSSASKSLRPSYPSSRTTIRITTRDAWCGSEMIATNGHTNVSRRILFFAVEKQTSPRNLLPITCLLFVLASRTIRKMQYSRSSQFVIEFDLMDDLLGLVGVICSKSWQMPSVKQHGFNKTEKHLMCALNYRDESCSMSPKP